MRHTSVDTLDMQDSARSSDDGTEGSLVESLRDRVMARAVMIEKDQTPIAIHETRVTIRRLRTLLRTCKRAVHGPRKRSIRLLGEMAREFAALRNADAREGLTRRILAHAIGCTEDERRRVLELLSQYREWERRDLVRRLNAPHWWLLKLHCIKHLGALKPRPLSKRRRRKALSRQRARSSSIP